MKEDYELLVDFRRYIIAEELEFTEESLHAYLTSTEYKILKGYLKVENTDKKDD